MRCRACGARNPDGAQWCSQCYETLIQAVEEPPAEEPANEEEEAAVAPETDAAPVGSAAATPAATEADTSPVVADGEETADAREVEAGDVRRTAEGVLEWRCARCETWNPLAQDRCSACGGTFADTVRGHEPEAVPSRDPTSVLVASVLLPGLGHAMLGQVAQAIVRGATYVLWLGGAIALFVGGRGSGLLLPVVPLFVGAAVLLAVTVRDVIVVQSRRGSELLTARAFLWLVVAVLVGLLLSFVPAIFRLGGA